MGNSALIRNQASGLLCGLGLLAATASPAWSEEDPNRGSVASRPEPEVEPAPAMLTSVPPAPPAPRRVQSDDDERPSHPAVESRADASGPNLGLVITGTSMLMMGWLFSSLSGALAGSGEDYLYPSNSGPAHYSNVWPLFVPALGPFIQLGYVNLQTDPSLGPVLVIDGLVQASGLVMLIAGAAAGQSGSAQARNDLRVAPILTPGGSSLMVLGRF